MKKIYVSLTILSLITILTGCFKKDVMSIKDKNPDAKFTCALLKDSSLLNNNAEITVVDKVVFSSNGKFDECASNFVIFTGKSGHKYQPNYVMFDPTKKSNDSIQSARGEGEVLDTVGGKFVSKPVIFDVAGTYTVYAVASFLNKKTGEYKEKIDSMIINVTDPSVKSTQLTSLVILPSSARGKSFTAMITQDSILFSNVTIADFKYNSEGTAVIKYTPLTMTIKKGDQVIKTNETNLKLVQGDILSVTSPDGTTTKNYIVGIKIYKSISKDPKLAKVTVSQAKGFLFSDLCTILGTTIKLPNWPIGTPAFVLTYNTYNTAGVSVKKTDTVTVANISTKIITSLAQDGVTKLDYTLIAPTTEYDAKVTDVVLSNATGAHISKAVDTYTIYSDSLSLKKAVVKLSIKDFAVVKVDSLGTGFVDFSNSSTTTNLYKYPSVKFRVYNGTDSTTISVKALAW